MKYLVVSTRRDESFESTTISAELESKELAQELMYYWNTVDKSQYTEIHPIMNDEEVRNFLNKYNYILEAKLKK